MVADTAQDRADWWCRGNPGREPPPSSRICSQQFTLRHEIPCLTSDVSAAPHPPSSASSPVYVRHTVWSVRARTRAWISSQRPAPGSSSTQVPAPGPALSPPPQTTSPAPAWPQRPSGSLGEFTNTAIINRSLPLYLAGGSARPPELRSLAGGGGQAACDEEPGLPGGGRHRQQQLQHGGVVVRQPGSAYLWHIMSSLLILKLRAMAQIKVLKIKYLHISAPG